MNEGIKFLEYFNYTFYFQSIKGEFRKQFTKINVRQNVSKQDKSLMIIRRDAQVYGSSMLVVWYDRGTATANVEVEIQVGYDGWM